MTDGFVGASFAADVVVDVVSTIPLTPQPAFLPLSTMSLLVMITAAMLMRMSKAMSVKSCRL